MPEDVYRGTVYPHRRRRRTALRTVAFAFFVITLLYLAATVGIGR